MDSHKTNNSNAAGPLRQAPVVAGVGVKLVDAEESCQLFLEQEVALFKAKSWQLSFSTKLTATLVAGPRSSVAGHSAIETNALS